MSPSDDNHPASDALAFHRLAGDFLGAQGFALLNAPEVVVHFGGSQAFYRSERGLALSVGFEPVDGNFAEVSFGREWYWNERRLFLSNSYSSMARRFGLDVPVSYPMGRGAQQRSVVVQIVADLERTLPIILPRVSLEDLLAVENEEPFGAAVHATRSFGGDYSAHVHITGFLG